MRFCLRPLLLGLALSATGSLCVSGGLALMAPALASAQDGEPTEASADPGEGADTVPEGQPRYLEAMQAELAAMRVRSPSCEAVDAQRARCRFTARGLTTGRDFAIRLVYSDRTDTVYLYVERYLRATAEADTTLPLLRRLMELNWTILLGKFEWDPTDGEVRLAMILNTDSNFDRRAFRSAIRGIGQLADRYLLELERIQRGQEAPPAPGDEGPAEPE